jgi:hypothetical protein
MPIPNSWGKGSSTNKTSSMTGIFPGAWVVNGTLQQGAAIAAATATTSGVFIPFADITGLNIAGSSPEIGWAPAGEAGPDGNANSVREAWKEAGAARFMLGILEASFAAQQNHPVADRLGNCVMTRSSLSVVDEDTLQKTFTVKFKLSHTSQEIEDE